MKSFMKIVKNKYFIATVIFLVIFMFLSENNVLVTLRLKREVHQLEQQSEALAEGIRRDSANAVAVKHDLAAVERYGREHYYMKRDDEDIYIIK